MKDNRQAKKTIQAQNDELMQLYKWEDDLYHRYSVFCGLSDPAIWILYSIYNESEHKYTQYDLVSKWFYPKQTVNYTVNALIKKGWITLEQMSGARNAKAILLTEAGKNVCKEKICPLMEAEVQSLSRMTDEERELLVKLTKMQIGYFEEELNKITEEK